MNKTDTVYSLSIVAQNTVIREKIHVNAQYFMYICITALISHDYDRIYTTHIYNKKSINYEIPHIQHTENWLFRLRLLNSQSK